jgi:zinc protease
MKRITFCLSLIAAAALAVTSARAQFAQNVHQSKIEGIELYAYKTGVKDVVYLRGSMPAGDDKAPADHVELATLVGGMLERGTTKQDKLTIAAKLDAVGATISFSVGTNALQFTGRCLAKDVPLVVELIAEQLREPAFLAEELEKLKKQSLGGLQRALEDTSFRATDQFTRAAYPASHPNHGASVEQRTASIEKATVDDLKKFHAAHYGPAHLKIVAAGDIDPKKVESQLQAAFAGWRGGSAPLQVAKADLPADVKREHTVFMPDKTSVNVIIGQPTQLRYGEGDYLALRVGASVLGGASFSGRLMKNTREKEGLTYGIYSNLHNDTFTDGDFQLTATFAPALLDKGIASAQRHLREWHAKGVTAKELEDHKGGIVGAFKIGLATTDGIAQALLNSVNRGMGPTWLDQYPQRVNALTVEQVNSAIKKHLNPDEMLTVKAGTVPGATQ